MVVLPISTVMPVCVRHSTNCVIVFDPVSLKTRIDELQKLTAEPDFWSSDNAHEVNRRSPAPVEIQQDRNFPERTFGT